MQLGKKIKVLIVDDSSLVREMLFSILSSDNDIEVVGMAKDGLEAIDKTILLNPDVITMDINMPNMDGFTSIEKIMQNKPTPIIVVSSQDVSIIVKALSLGAMDFVSSNQNIENIAKELLEKIKIASKIKPIRAIKIVSDKKSTSEITFKNTNKIVLIGASTGGPQAVFAILKKLPKKFPFSIAIVQHMSKGFLEGYAQWLKDCCELDVKIASNNDLIESSSIFIAPDNYNMIIGKDKKIVLQSPEKDALHVPSIDVMMISAAQNFKEDCIGIILSGMGRDGFEGIKSIKLHGGKTIAQSEDTSAVYGMNKICVEAGYIDYVLPIEKITDKIFNLIWMEDIYEKQNSCCWW